MSSENLPVAVGENQLMANKRNQKRRIDGIKRVGKIILKTGISASGLALMCAGSGPIALIGGGAFLVSGINASIDIILKSDKDSMFTLERRLNGEINIAQDTTKIRPFLKMKDFDKGEKAAMMGLDLLVKLKNMKQELSDKETKTTPSKDGKNNVYPQKFCTETHSVNLDTMYALSMLGYIQIEKEKVTKNNMLIIPRLQFGEIKTVINDLKDKDKRKDDEREMHKVTLKLTDKPVDIDELCRISYDCRKKSDDPALRAVGRIFRSLRKKNIDITTDEYGKTIIDRNAEKPFIQRIKEQSTNKCEEYRKSLYIADEIDLTPTKQKTQEPEQIHKKEEQEAER